MHNSGQCHCGAVQFQVEGEPIRMAQCHCNACRRLTGTGHVVHAFFKKEQVKITGETSFFESISDAGNTRHRHFCPKCGSTLFSESSRAPGAIGIAVGTFDNSDWFSPQVILYNKERPAWDVIDPQIEVHDFM